MLISLVCFSQKKTTITFQVSTDSILKQEDAILNIGIRGSIAPLTWVKGVKLKDADGDGIYTTSIIFELEKDTNVYFKYVLNEVEWEQGEARKLELKLGKKNIVKHFFRYEKHKENPFKKFIGEWTLKNDTWQQSDDNIGIQQLKIPNHYSKCTVINTNNSLLWLVDATSARGHILWVYNQEKNQLQQLSSFYPSRSGVGEGTIENNGNAHIKVFFEGEAKNTYRLYTYTWISENEYILKSTQYNSKDQPTGSFYGGTFIRLPSK